MPHIGLMEPGKFDELLEGFNVVARGWMCNKKIEEGPEHDGLSEVPASHHLVVIDKPARGPHHNRVSRGQG